MFMLEKHLLIKKIIFKDYKSTEYKTFYSLQNYRYEIQACEQDNNFSNTVKGYLLHQKNVKRRDHKYQAINAKTRFMKEKP